MAVYMILKITVHNDEKLKAYKNVAPKIIALYGGEILGRSSEVVLLEGDDNRRTVIIEFPTMDMAKNFYNSPEYTNAILLRKEAADFDVILVDGVTIDKD